MQKSASGQKKILCFLLLQSFRWNPSDCRNQSRFKTLLNSPRQLDNSLGSPSDVAWSLLELAPLSSRRPYSLTFTFIRLHDPPQGLCARPLTLCMRLNPRCLMSRGSEIFAASRKFQHPSWSMSTSSTTSTSSSSSSRRSNKGNGKAEKVN